MSPLPLTLANVTALADLADQYLAMLDELRRASAELICPNSAECAAAAAVDAISENMRRMTAERIGGAK